MKLLTIKEASEFATKYAKKQVTSSNISYLINYACVTAHYIKDRGVCVDEEELVKYYDERQKKKASVEGGDPELAFDNLKESETTKHVHRLHPYKGKYIPQLVEHYAKKHFKPGQIVLDPFLGSGTTLVELAEHGIHGIGVDISEFNVVIAEVKLQEWDWDFDELEKCIKTLTKELDQFPDGGKRFDELDNRLYKFNQQHFPSPEFKRLVKDQGRQYEKEEGSRREIEFIEANQDILNCKVEIEGNSFIAKWYTKPIQNEINFLNSLIKQQPEKFRKALMVILSRTVRSCRSTTHNDLTTLNNVVRCPYYCRKHKKLCRPIYSLRPWWKRYSQDTFDRLQDYAKLRKDKVYSLPLQGDSAEINLEERVPELAKNKIDGIITSPPYVGVIDYHDQHAYAYEIFGIPKHEEQEIGSLKKRKSKQAIQQYQDDMVRVFRNCKKFTKEGANFFVVVNDDLGLYEEIFQKSGLTIVGRRRRLVSNRTESTKPYFETIFQVQ